MLRITFRVSYSQCTVVGVYSARCTASVRLEEDSWAGGLSVIIMSTNSIQQQQQHHWEQHWRLVEFSQRNRTNSQHRQSAPASNKVGPVAQLNFPNFVFQLWTRESEGGWEWLDDVRDSKCQLRKCCYVAVMRMVCPDYICDTGMLH